MSIEHMNFYSKSERNAILYKQHELERRQISSQKPKRPAPRFGPFVEIPQTPEGMVLHKFYGRPVFLTAREDDELLVGKTPYTERQLRELQKLKEIFFRIGKVVRADIELS